MTRRYGRPLSIATLVLCALLLTSVGSAGAQGAPHVTLVGRAILPPDSFSDGPPSGSKLGKTPIHGAPVPFPNQPVGSFSAVIPGEYKGTWLTLSDHGFDKPGNATDLLVRTYTVEIDWHTASGGGGTLSVDDWKTFNDSKKHLPGGLNGHAQLFGSELDPRAIAVAANGTYWVADNTAPAIFSVNDTDTIQSFTTLPRGVQIEGMGIKPDGKTLLVAIRGNGAIGLFTFDTTASKLTNTGVTYRPDSGSNITRGWVPINDTEALVIDEDTAAHTNAALKHIYVVDVTTGDKTPLVDLLNIDDPNALATSNAFNNQPGGFGLSNPFKFPYDEVSNVYPIDANTLLVVNNNHFPFSLARDGKGAAPTELIALQLDQPLNLTVPPPPVK